MRGGRAIPAGAALLPLLVTAGLACEPKDPARIVDLPIQTGPQCEFTNGGRDDYYDAYAGQPVIDLGGGKLAQIRSHREACLEVEELLVTDCNTRETILIGGAPPPGEQDIWEPLRVRYLQQYGGGPIALRASVRVPELAAISARAGFSHALGADAINTQGAENRADPFCGCALFYPDLEAAR